MKKFVIMLVTFLFLFLIDDSFARAGKGFSSGFRSYKTQEFNRVNKNPSQPSPYQQQKQIQPNYQPQAKPSFFSNPIFKWLIGGLIFGAVLSLLLGHGLHFGMPGLLEILLILVIIYFIIRIFVKKKEEQPTYATNVNNIPEQVNQYSESTIAVGPYINEELILNLAKNAFIDIQKAWSEGNLESVKNFLTDRMYFYLNSQLQDLKAKGLRNIIEDIKILDTQIVHVEEEGDNKVVIVEIEAEGKDYTIDSYGNIVEGNKNNTVKFKEYWAFVGKALNWKLDDIRQVEDV